MTGNSPRQEAFFIVGIDTDDIIERDFYQEAGDPSVSIVERAIHLHNALGLFSKVNVRRAFVDELAQKRPEVIRRKYGQNAEAVIAGAEASAERLFTEAKWELSRAFGMMAVRASGEVNGDRLIIGTQREFTKLWSRFGLPSNVRARMDKREQLEGIINAFQKQISIQHREAGERPFKDLVAKDDSSQLGTQERLQALWDDERAGYLPPTHIEKNMVLAFLDYQDNPEYNFGIRDQLLEIAYRHYGRHGGELGRDYANQAAASITYEIEDMLRNASEQLVYLRDLEACIQDCPNPFVSLAEEIGPTNPGYAPLLRFMDLSELRDTGRVKGLPRDPLRTFRNEFDVEPELKDKKNKIEEDQYTRHTLRPVFEKRIAKFPGRVKIREMREVISEAISNEEKRAFYMHARLLELNQPDKGGPLERASLVARFALQRLAS